jgi:hypothetical protein
MLLRGYKTNLMTKNVSTENVAFIIDINQIFFVQLNETRPLSMKNMIKDDWKSKKFKQVLTSNREHYFIGMSQYYPCNR